MLPPPMMLPVAQPGILNWDGGRIAARGKKVWGPEPPELGDFSIKIMHFYAHFGQNSYFKAITYQLKAFKGRMHCFSMQVV